VGTDDERREHREYMRAWRARQRGVDVVAPDGEDGPVVEAVTAELVSLSATESRPGLAEACLAMARILDQPKLSTTHPSAAHQLARGLDEIRNSSHVARGKLASVAQLANRKPS
jgi:hypothetical protein